MNRITILIFAAAAALSVALFVNLKRGTTPPASPVAAATDASDPAPQPAAAAITASPVDSFQSRAEPNPTPDRALTGWKSSATPPTRAMKPQPSARADLGPLVRNTPPEALPIPEPDEPVIPRHVARAALSLVGADEEAEEIWAAAINDPAMPAEVRKDLIEDLNEDGFPDPKNITEDDLPLILSRLELIEAIAPDSMDETNYEAFRESYKDLVNMLNKLNR